MELDFKLRYDPELESYRTFFDHEWARAIDAVAKGTKLDPPTFALCVNWKAAANNCVLPWMMAEAVSQLGHGILRTKDPYGSRFARFFKKELFGPFGKSMPKGVKSKLTRKLDEITHRISCADEVARKNAALNRQDVWRSLFETGVSHELILALWGSQRTSFGAIYHAYENFVRQCTGLALEKKGEYRPRFSEFPADVRQAFGEDIAKECMEDKPVRIARLVRNSLAHNGGTVTSEFDRRENAHGLVVDDRIFQIMAPDTRTLFNDLKGRALHLVEHAVKLRHLH